MRSVVIHWPECLVPGCFLVVAATCEDTNWEKINRGTVVVFIELLHSPGSNNCYHVIDGDIKRAVYGPNLELLMIRAGSVF